MPTVLHPRALEETDGSPPHRVVIERERFDIDQDDYTIDLDTERQVEQLAEAHGVDRAAIDPGGGSAGDTQPDTCETVKNDGDVCGRERPCPYHG